MKPIIDNAWGGWEESNQSTVRKTSKKAGWHHSNKKHFWRAFWKNCRKNRGKKRITTISRPKQRARSSSSGLPKKRSWLFRYHKGNTDLALHPELQKISTTYHVKALCPQAKEKREEEGEAGMRSNFAHSHIVWTPQTPPLSLFTHTNLNQQDCQKQACSLGKSIMIPEHFCVYSARNSV